MSNIQGQVEQAYPSTFSALEQLVFTTCEGFIEAARSVASLEGVSLTLTHKSRNSPGKEASQYRGCVVLNCQQWEQGCTFELKAYGPIEGGWRMRPLQHPGLKKHTVTSWCICNHPKAPMRLFHVPAVTTFNELIASSFSKPDDFIATATQVANLSHVQVYLLTLMISDGKPKPNGRNGDYIPRGFLTLECVEAENGCPFAIKAREEEHGWVMRPWREKGKGDLKGAVSVITCKHGAEYAADFHNKASGASKSTRKSKAAKAKGQSASPGPLPDIPSGLDNNSGLDPSLTHLHSGFPSSDVTLSPSQIMSSIEESLSDPNSFLIDDAAFSRFTDPNPHSHHNNNYDNEIDENDNHDYSNSSSLEQFRSALNSYPTNTNLDLSTSSSTASSSNLNNNLLSTASPSTINPSLKRSATSLDSPTRSPAKKPRKTNQTAALKASWKQYLVNLDPEGRLNALLNALAQGGIDPGAVVAWPAEEVGHFVDMVGGEVALGVKVHFKHLLKSEGKRVWDEMNAANA